MKWLHYREYYIVTILMIVVRIVKYQRWFETGCVVQKEEKYLTRGKFVAMQFVWHGNDMVSHALQPCFCKFVE